MFETINRIDMGIIRIFQNISNKITQRIGGNNFRLSLICIFAGAFFRMLHMYFEPTLPIILSGTAILILLFIIYYNTVNSSDINSQKYVNPSVDSFLPKILRFITLFGFLFGGGIGVLLVISSILVLPISSLIEDPVFWKGASSSFSLTFDFFAIYFMACKP